MFELSRESSPSRWSIRSPSASRSSSNTDSSLPAPDCPRSVSSRNWSAQAPSTVVDAYDRLVARGADRIPCRAWFLS